jgi:hypothetical protein
MLEDTLTESKDNNPRKFIDHIFTSFQMPSYLTLRRLKAFTRLAEYTFSEVQIVQLLSPYLFHNVLNHTEIFKANRFAGMKDSLKAFAMEKLDENPTDTHAVWELQKVFNLASKSSAALWSSQIQQAGQPNDYTIRYRKQIVKLLSKEFKRNVPNMHGKRS